MRQGFVLVEVSMSYLIMTLAVAALVPTFLLAIRANKNTEKIQIGTDLATELLEEVRLRRWDELTPIPAEQISFPSVLGLDAGETAGDKRTFDDIDDFNGWAETGVMDPIMRPVTGLSQYSRSVAIAYLDPALNVVGGPTDFKRVTSCAWISAMNPICLQTVVTNR